MFVIRRLAFVTGAAFLALLMSSAKTVRAEEADAFLTETHRVLSEIRDNEQYDAEVKRALIEHELDERLDLPTMSRLALGRQEESFSRSELSEFIQEYSRFLTYTYLQEIAWTDPKEIPTIESSVVDAKTGWVTIGTKAKRRQSAASQRNQYRASSVFRAEYLLRKRHGSWRIAKIRFNGVDLNTAFGAQFEAMLKKSTPEEVLAKLQSLNTRRESENPLE